MKQKLITAGLAIFLSAFAALADDAADCLLQRQSADYSRALVSCTIAAEQGDASAQSNLGWMYQQGLGVAQDNAAAVRWYRAAAEQDDAGAQFNLGLIYENGVGVAQDYAEAVRWHRAAAEQGHVRAQNNLGVKYANGQGVIQNYVQAHVWFNIAAAKGEEEAAENRNRAADLMTPQQIAEAQSRAQRCLDSNYKDC
jgi:uncharacterized protein